MEEQDLLCFVELTEGQQSRPLSLPQNGGSRHQETFAEASDRVALSSFPQGVVGCRRRRRAAAGVLEPLLQVRKGDEQALLEVPVAEVFELRQGESVQRLRDLVEAIQQIETAHPPYELAFV